MGRASRVAAVLFAVLCVCAVACDTSGASINTASINSASTNTVSINSASTNTVSTNSASVTTASVNAASPAGAQAQAHQPFVITGDLTGALAPGSPSRALDLTLTNPNKQAIAIGSLTVTVVGTSAGKACGAGNFDVRQFSGQYPVNVAGHQSASLTQLGVAKADLPHVRMIDKKSNQDTCKGVTVVLSYQGTGEGS